MENYQREMLSAGTCLQANDSTQTELALYFALCYWMKANIE